MPALRKDPSKVKSRNIVVRISPDEQRALQEWKRSAKLSPTTNERITISEILRQALIQAITTK
jgi:hypothetical protein